METTRRVTPSAYLVLSADAPRDAWLGERKNGITATDLPAILGLSQYKTAIDVWTDKLGTREDTFEAAIGSGEAAFWGIQLEDTVARAWADHVGFSIRRIGIIEHDTDSWMRASLDRLVTGCPDGRCALEVKTRSARVSETWDEGVPADVLAQVEWQLLVSGLDHIHVIALLGGQRLVQHRVERSGIDAPRLIEPARLVWEAVASGEAPRLPETVWTDEYLEQLHPTHEGELEVNTETLLTATAYEEVVQQIKVLDDRKSELRIKLVGALGDHETATWNGSPVYSYKTSTSKRLDSKALAEHFPEVAADDRVWNVSTTKTLRITTKKEK